MLMPLINSFATFLLRLKLSLHIIITSLVESAAPTDGSIIFDSISLLPIIYLDASDIGNLARSSWSVIITVTSLIKEVKLGETKLLPI